MIYSLAHPEWITLTLDGKSHVGYDQEWYPEKWQKLAGCGPTTGSVIAAYIEAKEKGVHIETQKDALDKMLTFWPYATPRMHGLYKTRWLEEGLTAYIRDHHLVGRTEMISIPPIRPLRPSLAKVALFLKEGLLADAPVGFLNLHNGGNEALYSWHWMPFIQLEEKERTWIGTAVDEGKEITFDLGEWLKKSKFGGGFVRVMDTSHVEIHEETI